MGAAFAQVVTAGPLVVAVAVAALAGLVSFLSPCVLPLVPGYLSYVTGLSGLTGVSGVSGVSGLSGADLAARRSHRGRVLAGVALFLAGFSAVFIAGAVLASQLGLALYRHRRVVEIVVGALIIVFGLAFAGLLPAAQRQWWTPKLPAAGLLAAPVFGAVFALSWIPCVGPTLGAVLGLAATGGSPVRAVLLSVAYCLGLGLPFLAVGLGLPWVLTAVAAVRRHGQWVSRLGGALLVLTGLALVTGVWTAFVDWLRASTSGFGVFL